MEISKAAVGIFAVVCMAGGAGGAYLATRGEPSVAMPDLQEVLVSPDPAAVVAADQSEGIIGDLHPAEAVPVPAAAPPVRPAPPAAVAPARTAPAPRAEAPQAPRSAPSLGPTLGTEPAEAELTPLPPIEPPQIAANEPSRWVAPAPVYDELVVAADSVIGLQVETTVSSETAQVEDRVTARVTRDVRVDERIAIPAGARLEGEVTEVERGGRVRERARLGIRFTSLVLADGTRVPLMTETVYREGDAPGSESAAKIGGGAIGGAIIGGILGGAKGAAIGSTAGAGAGTAAVLAGGRNPATLQAGSPVTVRVERPVVIVVER